MRNLGYQQKSLGDCNLFLNDPEDDCCGEIEVMIAEPRARLKGCATEALKLLMGYCYDTIRISKFVAKIGKHNLKSYSLFKNKVGFSAEKSSFSRHYKNMLDANIYELFSAKIQIRIGV